MTNPVNRTQQYQKEQVKLAINEHNLGVERCDSAYGYWTKDVKSYLRHALRDLLTCGRRWRSNTCRSPASRAVRS